MDNSDPVISPEMAEGISYGFIGIMALGINSETKATISLYRVKDSFVEISDNGKAFRDAYKKLNNEDLLKLGDDWEMGDSIPTKNSDFLESIDKNFTEADKANFDKLETDFNIAKKNNPNLNLKEFSAGNPDFAKLTQKIDDLADPSKLKVLNKNIKAINNVDAVNFKGAFKGAGSSAAFAAGITMAMQLGTTGQIDQEELALAVGGALIAEGAEFVIKKGVGAMASKSSVAVAKAGPKALAKAQAVIVKEMAKTGITKGSMAAAQKGGTAAAVKVASKLGTKTAVKGAAAGAKLASKAAAGPIGVAFMVFDVVNIALDMADVCGYTKNEMTQGTLNDIHDSYLASYKESYNTYGVEYPLEAKPNLTSTKNKADLQYHFMDYIDKCNLILNKKVFDDVQKKKMRRRRRFRKVATGQIITLFMDQSENLDSFALLLIAFNKRKQEQKQNEINTRQKLIENEPFYKNPTYQKLFIFGFIGLGVILALKSKD